MAAQGLLKASRRAVLVAVKTLHPDASASAIEELEAERNLMMQIRHRNLVCLLRVVTASRPQMLVMEYLSTSLDKWLEENGSTASHEHLLSIARQVASGVRALHEFKIVHRDLAARNVLLRMLEEPGHLFSFRWHSLIPSLPSSTLWSRSSWVYPHCLYRSKQIGQSRRFWLEP